MTPPGDLKPTCHVKSDVDEVLARPELQTSKDDPASAGMSVLAAARPAGSQHTEPGRPTVPGSYR
jgi:hypothetical protein